ncbi:MAG TPA: hypothetical protein VKY26_03745, partial [Actinomycetota bacterium]|nr:hypothetical protein [Actinomycetota bacterium]
MAETNRGRRWRARGASRAASHASRSSCGAGAAATTAGVTGGRCSSSESTRHVSGWAWAAVQTVL